MIGGTGRFRGWFGMCKSGDELGGWVEDMREERGERTEKRSGKGEEWRIVDNGNFSVV